MTHIVDTTVATITSAYGLLVQTNTGITGTVTIADARGTQAVITNPVTGNAYRYFGLNGPITVTASAVGDFTVSVLNHQG